MRDLAANRDILPGAQTHRPIFEKFSWHGLWPVAQLLAPVTARSKIVCTWHVRFKFPMLSLWGFVHFLRDRSLRREKSTGLHGFQLCYSRHVQVRDLVRRVPSKNHLFVSLQSKVGRQTCSMLKSMGAFADPISFARRGDILRQNVAKPHNW